MAVRKNWATLGVLGLALLLASRTPARAGEANFHDSSAQQGQRAELGAHEEMASHHAHTGPHFKLTPLRPETPQDGARADTIAKTLRQTLTKYKDYHAALADGYRPFLPIVPQPEYHFTNYWHGFLNAFTFDPARPTSLLYRKTPEGHELVGAMYTASRFANEESLDKRIPLSVARWHAHVNICLPPRGEGAAADWTKFGPRGSIATREACREAGGRWRPQLFGWMVHVYPFEDTPEKIWTHH